MLVLSREAGSDLNLVKSDHIWVAIDNYTLRWRKLQFKYRFFNRLDILWELALDTSVASRVDLLLLDTTWCSFMLLPFSKVQT